MGSLLQCQLWSIQIRKIFHAMLIGRAGKWVLAKNQNTPKCTWTLEGCRSVLGADRKQCTKIISGICYPSAACAPHSSPRSQLLTPWTFRYLFFLFEWLSLILGCFFLIVWQSCGIIHNGFKGRCEGHLWIWAVTKTGKCQKLPEDKLASMGWSTHTKKKRSDKSMAKVSEF